jgi:hypothetical protein
MCATLKPGNAQSPLDRPRNPVGTARITLDESEQAPRPTESSGAQGRGTNSS